MITRGYKDITNEEAEIEAEIENRIKTEKIKYENSHKIDNSKTTKTTKTTKSITLVSQNLIILNYYKYNNTSTVLSFVPSKESLQHMLPQHILSIQY